MERLTTSWQFLANIQMRCLHYTLLNVKCHCLPALLYSGEVWHLNDSNMHKISVSLNSCFIRIFSCCWWKSVKPLDYFCHTLPISYLLHQRKLLFWKSYIALILLFYSRYLFACIRLLLLWIVFIMCYCRNCQTSRWENWLGTHLQSP